MIFKPKRLQKQDTIGVVAPSGVVDEIALKKGVKVLENLGYSIKIGDSVLKSQNYLAGDDISRKNDIESMFKDPQVNAIACTRGGYGAARLLDKIDYKIIKDNPKIFCGYSDITALQMAFLKECGLVTFFAPMVASDFGKDEANALTLNSFEYIFNSEYQIPLVLKPKKDYKQIIQGQAQGKLFIANAAVLTSLLGSKFMPDLKGYILVIEDICEPLYKIDRMLSSLRLAGVLESLNGLVIGDFTNSQSTQEEIIDMVRNTIPNIPCGIGFNLSHEPFKYTCPNGVEARFNSNNGELTILEEFFKEDSF